VIPDTPRVVDPECDVFEIQEKIIEDILSTQENIQALESAPKTIDPMQQTSIVDFAGDAYTPLRWIPQRCFTARLNISSSRFLGIACQRRSGKVLQGVSAIT
jgi:hypothetical protein